MANYKKTEAIQTGGFKHYYEGISKEELNKKIDEMFSSLGYKIQKGDLGNGVYEKGNRTMRILFGAFVKYFKFGVLVVSHDDNTVSFELKKETSGMSGGLIGMNQVKKEIENLSEKFKSI